MFKILGIIVMILFYGSYLLKAIIQSQNGIKTNQMGLGIKPKKTLIIEIVLKTMTLLMIIIQIVSILFLEESMMLFSNVYFRITGFFIATIGSVMLITAMMTMRDSWRAGITKTEKTELIFNGIYQFSRNPAFVGFDLFYMGLSLAFSNIFNVIFTIFIIILFHFQILEEEKHLEQEFNENYTDYKKKTKRYLGRVKKGIK